VENIATYHIVSYHITLVYTFTHPSSILSSYTPSPPSTSQMGSNAPFPSLIPSSILLFIRNYKPPRILFIPNPRPCSPRTSLSSVMSRNSFSPSSLPCPLLSVMRALPRRSPEWILIKSFIGCIGPFSLRVIIALVVGIGRWWRGARIWRSRVRF